MRHEDFWAGLDALARRRGWTASGLARAAGLDPTTFNRSKRLALDGKPRWPSTESLARALEAADASLEEFGALAAGRRSGAGRSIPIVGMARAGAHGFFDESGFPVGADETVRFPNLGEDRVYALEVSGDSMEPLYRNGDVVIVQPGADVRRGDRIVVRTIDGEVMAKELGRRSDEVIELVSVNPIYPARTLPAGHVEWIARILWASQ
jgi:phage repressor protein C with HTH and peptisase S24 domain